MNFRRLCTIFAGFGILLGVLAIDHWIFVTWFNTTHLKWYLATGASINLVSSIVSMAWGDMEEKLTGLISSHPFDYMGTCLQLVGLPIYLLGTHMQSNKGESRPPAILDRILTVPLVLVLVGVLVIWLVVIAPPQYFVNLICGAPARILSQSKRQPIVKLEGTQLDVVEVGCDGKIPEGWVRTNLSQKPVAITGLFASLLFLIVKPLVNG